jgi:hypothetical protein
MKICGIKQLCTGTGTTKHFNFLQTKKDEHIRTPSNNYSEEH